MSRKLIIASVLAVLAVVFFAVMPWMVGKTVQANLVNNLLQRLPADVQSQLRVSELSYDRGWFASSASYAVNYQPLGSTDSLPLQFDLQLQHGPLVRAREDWRLALASAQVQSRINSAEVQQLLAEIPDQLPDIDLDMIAGFDQSIDLQLRIEPLQLRDANGDFRFQGMTGSLHAAADNSAAVTLSMGALSLKTYDSGYGFALQGLELDSATAQVNDVLAPSHATVQIPSLRGNGLDAAQNFAAEGIAFSSRLSDNAANSQLLDAAQQISVQSIQSEFPVASLDWSLQVNRLSRDVLRSYSQLLAQAQSQTVTGGPVTTNVTQLGMELGTRFLRNELQILNASRVNAYGGDHSADLRLDYSGLPNLTEIARLDINELIAALDVSIELDLDLEALSRSPMAGMIDPYVQEGYIVIDNGRVKLLATLSDRQLVLNGESMPIEQFF